MFDTKINHHVFLSDLRTAALLDQQGSVVWFCIPRLDGAPLMGALLGGDEFGIFSLRPRDQPDVVAQQAYLSGTLISRTEFENLTIIDYLDCGAGRAFQRAGRSDLVRHVQGSAPVALRFAPKFDFGRIPTRLVLVEGGLRVMCGQNLVTLHAPGVEFVIERVGDHDEARAEFVPGKGVTLQLSVGTGAVPSARTDPDTRHRRTENFWKAWLSTLSIPPVATTLVAQSALVLRGLCYGPSGAIAAAATTSLPECIGGERNWDYRFCWPRDAAFSAHALLRLGTSGPGMRLLDWLLELFEECGEEEFLRPVYTLSGRHILGEAEIPEAKGYANSRPVRVGNLAAQQLQLDSLGPIALLLGALARSGAALSPEHHQLAERMVALVEHRWRDPDHGIWEVRTEQKHFVHSKLMCWLTVTEAIAVAEYLGVDRPEWRELQRTIRDDIERHGFNSGLQSYTAAYGSADADAALLWITLSGFHPPEHPRSAGTVRFVMNRLLRQDSVYRYRYDDALSGDEGSFTICTGWLIEVLVMMGRRAEAERLFAALCASAGPTGLLAEQWDPRSGLALGNFPQAYSHLALINAAVALSADRYCPLTSLRA